MLNETVSTPAVALAYAPVAVDVAVSVQPALCLPSVSSGRPTCDDVIIAVQLSSVLVCFIFGSLHYDWLILLLLRSCQMF